MRKLTIYRCFFTNADCYKAHIPCSPKGIQVHSTGSNNSYLKRYVQPDDGRLGKNLYNNSHNKSGLTVCANAYIGKLENGTVAVYQALDWEQRCWLSGSGAKGNANKLDYIGFEICEDNLTNKDYFQAAVMEQSVLLVAYLCNKYNIPVSMVHDHKELYGMGLASNHADIRHWLTKYGLTMDDYRAAVEAAMKEGVQVTYIEGNNVVAGDAQPKKEEPQLTTLYKATIYSANGHNKNMRAKTSTSSTLVTTVPPNATVEVLEETNTEWAKINYNGTVGYMMREFLKKVVETPVIQEPTAAAPSNDALYQLREQLQIVVDMINSIIDED